jgi:hypothetical protein
MGGGEFESLAFKGGVPGFRLSTVGNAYMRSLLGRKVEDQMFKSFLILSKSGRLIFTVK